MKAVEAKAIIFDFDGVILDSVHLKSSLFISCYQPGLKDEQINAILNYQALAGGVSRRIKFSYFEEKIFGRSNLNTRVDALCDKYQKELMDRYHFCEYLPGALEFLEMSRQTMGLYLVSGTLQEDLEKIIADLNLNLYFRSIIGAPIEKTEAFSEILRENNLNSKDVIAIGDSLTEYEAAIETNIKFIGIEDDRNTSRFPRSVPVFPSLSVLLKQWELLEL